jgi:hypothetical protein
MMMVCRSRPLVFFVLVLIGAAGCGDGRTAGTVSGKVTVKGQPLADIGVNFEPQGEGAGRGSFGRTDSSGSYTLHFIDNDQAGAMVGQHQVTFRDLLSAAAEESDAGPMKKQTFRFPPKYMSEPLSFEVKPGSNQADFDLK